MCRQCCTTLVCGMGGYIVKTLEDGKAHYRRVCVDGPVFDAAILPEFFAD